jgi:hypothetical protein
MMDKALLPSALALGSSLPVLPDDALALQQMQRQIYDRVVSCMKLLNS